MRWPTALLGGFNLTSVKRPGIDIDFRDAWTGVLGKALSEHRTLAFSDLQLLEHPHTTPRHDRPAAPGPPCAHSCDRPAAS
jgi:hypothetical protein